MGFAVIVKASLPAVPPPGVGFTTVTAAAPGADKSAELMVAVSCVEFPNVVARLTPFHCTCDPLTNPVPVTVSVKPVEPAVRLAGEICVIAGAGLFTVKFADGDVPPPGGGFITVTATVPAVRTSED